EGGFVLAGGRWAPETIPQLQEYADYLVTLHISAGTEPWTAQFALLRVVDNRQLATWKCEGSPHQLSDAATAIVTRAVSELRTHADLAHTARPEQLAAPSGQLLLEYLLDLEASLSVTCADLAPAKAAFLHAERSIIDHALQLCAHSPDNVVMRLLLLYTLE